MKIGTFRFGIAEVGNFLLRAWCGVIFCDMAQRSYTRLQCVISRIASLSSISPLPIAGSWLCKTTEFIGGAFLVADLFIKPACVLLIVDMAVATFAFHHGLVLGNGLTTFLLLICLFNVILNEPGPISIDHLLKGSKKIIHE